MVTAGPAGVHQCRRLDAGLVPEGYLANTCANERDVQGQDGVGEAWPTNDK
jgi:hypothetical protein